MKNNRIVATFSIACLLGVTGSVGVIISGHNKQWESVEV